MAIIADIIEGDIELVDGEITTRRIYLLTSVGGSPSARHYNALTAPGVPRDNAPHPSIPGAKVQAIRAASHSTDPRTFRVEVTYSTSSGGGTGEDLSLDDPVDVSFSIRQLTDSTIRDRLGNVIETNWLASAGVQRDVHRVDLDRPAPYIEITRTTNIRPDTLTASYGGLVNAIPWSGYPRYQVRCDGFTASGSRGDKLWRVTGSFFPSPIGTWATTVTTNAQTIVPDNLRLGRGQEEYEVYELADLNRSGFVL